MNHKSHTCFVPIASSFIILRICYHLSSCRESSTNSFLVNMFLYIFTSLVVLGSMVTPGATLTVPNGLEKRASGDTMADPIHMWIDCSGGPRVCNVDCHAILCLGAPNPVQRAEGLNDDNRKQSGYTIFKHDQADRESRHVFVDDSVLQQVGNSGEEGIMANTVQGGRYEILYPVDPSENRSKFCRPSC